MARRFSLALNHVFGWQRLIAVWVGFGWLLAACSPVLPPPAEEATSQPTRTRAVMPTLLPSFTPSPAHTSTPDPLADLRGLEVRLLHPWTGGLAAALEKAVEDFNQTNEWGIALRAESSGSSMALAQRLDSSPIGDPPADLIIAPSENLLWWHTYGSRMRPLNDFLLDSPWGLSEARRADFPLVFWQQDQADGQQIGIPALRAPRVFFYNLTWASELGFSRPPESVEDFRQQACAAARANNADRTGSNDGTGGWIVDTDGWTIYAWLKSFGFGNPLAGEPPRLSFARPQTLQAAEFLRGMVRAALSSGSSPRKRPSPAAALCIFRLRCSIFPSSLRPCSVWAAKTSGWRFHFRSATGRWLWWEDCRMGFYAPRRNANWRRGCSSAG